MLTNANFQFRFVDCSGQGGNKKEGNNEGLINKNRLTAVLSVVIRSSSGYFYLETRFRK